MTKPKTKYTLITFYKFVDIENPKEIVEEHKQFCQDIGMKGRIFIGEEGINAQASANTGQLIAYKNFLANSLYFKDIPDFDEKATNVDEHKFPKMIVRYRKEIVALGVRYDAKTIEKAKHKVTPIEFKEIIDNHSDKYAILDMRNDYEYKLGHFKGAIPAGTVTFKEVNNLIDKYKKDFEGKQIVMYCTGGIRCEKLSAMFENNGLSNVLQLEGGVVKYINTLNDGNWLGNLYTFDDRVSTPVGDINTHNIIARCHYTDEPTEDYHNCRYGPCNAQIIAKPKEFRKHMGFCSKQCANSAYESLLLRDVSWDPLKYKELRGKIKQDPTKRDEITEQIQTHIRKWLHGVEFNHSEPVEERIPSA
jgi:UPF0176 protein